MSIGSFTLIRNENSWIAAHLLRVLPFLDEIVLFDGNSDDGTIEIIEAIQKSHTDGRKIRLFKGKDPENLQGDYAHLFNECLNTLTTDLAWFAHPDMWVVNPEQLLMVGKSAAIAMTTSMRSFAGEPGGPLYEIMGRSDAWKNIYRLRNPDLGAHYFGSYGSAREDVYFSQITGDEHMHYGPMLERYPYEIENSGLKILHFSDVRNHARRLGRMKTCLSNQNIREDLIDSFAERHPRVTLESGLDHAGIEYKFIPAVYPEEFLAARSQFAKYEKEAVLA